MKTRHILPFATTALMAALSGCGGESANINPEPNAVAYINGSCASTAKNCVEFALDYPVDGLNFTCSSDTSKTYITMIEPKSNAATGKCSEGDKVHFFIQEKTNQYIDLGTVSLSDIGMVSTAGAGYPRLSVLDMARGLTGHQATSLSSSDETIQVATAIVRLLQALSVEGGGTIAGDIQPLTITTLKKEQLANIAESVEVGDYRSGAYASILRPWVDVSQVSQDDAYQALNTLVYMNNSASYQANYPILAKEDSQLPQGLYGCNLADCKSTVADLKHLIGQYQLITDRSGYTFGYGMQWKGAVSANTTNPILTVSGELIRKVRPERMVAAAQTTWVNPLNKRIQGPFRFSVNDNAADDFKITQGKVFNDYLIAGTEGFYKLLTKSTTANPADYGQWQQTIGTDQFKGSFDAYKFFSVNFLDNRVFKTQKNVPLGSRYIFPIYATLTFNFDGGTTTDSIKLGVVLDEDGNIRTDIAPNATETDMSGQCAAIRQSGAEYVDTNGVQQYRIGVLGATDIDNKAVTLRMILANPKFHKLDGAVIGLNTKIEAVEGGNGQVVGGARANIGNLVAANSTRITLSDFNGSTVKWSNIYHAQLATYVAQNPALATDADKALVKAQGGAVNLDVAECYNPNKVRI
ncbi:flagellar protein FilF [Acinetobacter towneri]|uniref:putative pilus system protein FilF n=1 Tax=Acinetobacter towneri TaxID=202956 RepID=UPI001CE15DD6|nr:flagellar protein FilF [Acinetobacter towneri]MCA4780125.1 flagellar protein FilF [Acinetobacter towneri]MCA4785519.1 flagellar protein FilF [Acinetobacter towneri]MCA4786522.1 flagellar protein FilF [Acinetobacter towneri]MCA4796633.1 flagellar protein FilF [Acinetobacter towneri]MCA4801680.1 flagellar protein FilF [Acinetobacter towneri]